MKKYSEFNVEQCEGLPEPFVVLNQPNDNPIEPLTRATDLFASTKAEIRNSGTRAAYSANEDVIRMPHIDTFLNAELRAATLAHELIHWTQHPSRLNRDLGRDRWRDEGYAMEELVAELGSAFLCADLNINPETVEDNANYVGSWLKILKNDQRAIIRAASLASKAVEYLHTASSQKHSLSNKSCGEQLLAADVF